MTTMTIDKIMKTFDPSKPVYLQQHYKVAEVAEMLGWSRDKVRRTFRVEPGVLRSQELKSRAELGGKRQHIFITIPEAVILRVYRRVLVN